jgi:hypothetical protein
MTIWRFKYYKYLQIIAKLTYMKLKIWNFMDLKNHIKYREKDLNNLLYKTINNLL